MADGNIQRGDDYLEIEMCILSMIFSYMVLGYPQGSSLGTYNDFIRKKGYTMRCMLLCADEPLDDDGVNNALGKELSVRFPLLCFKTFEFFIVALCFTDGVNDAAQSENLSSLMHSSGIFSHISFYTSGDIKDLAILPDEYRRLCKLAEQNGGVPDRESHSIRLYALERELFDAMIEGKTENIDIALNAIARRVDKANCHDAVGWHGYFFFLWRYLDRVIFQRTGVRRTIPEKLSIDSQIQATESPDEVVAVMKHFVKKYSNAVGLDVGAENSYHIIIRRAKEYVLANCSKDVSLDAVASQVGFSSFYLSKLFKKEEGINFKDYVIKARMEKARSLICQSGMNVSEVSREVGYNNVDYFSKAFKSYFGMTARDMRLGGRNSSEA